MTNELTQKQARGWIGIAPTAIQSFAVLCVGVNGILIAGLQPLLLGLLAEEGRLSAEQLGETATVELLSMGVAAAIAGAKFPAERLPVVGMLSCTLLAILEVVTTQVQGGALVLARAAAGVPSGIMIWIATALIARSLTPDRCAGIYFTVQTLAQFFCAAAITAWVAPRYGANGGFSLLACLSMFVAAISFAMPRRFAQLTSARRAGEEKQIGGLPSARGFLALSAAFLYLAFIVGVWVYAEPLSREAGHEPSIAGAAISISLACQVIGGALATTLAGRLLWSRAVVLCSVLNAGCLIAFASLPTPVVFLATSGLFGFLWLFVLPFLVPMTIAADPTRRAALMLGGAQLLGSSFGPLLASMLVSERESRGALAFGAVALVTALVVAIALMWRERQDASAQLGGKVT